MKRSINITWTIYDIKEMIDRLDYPSLTDYQLSMVLTEVEKNHDAEIGINWDILYNYLTDYYNIKGISWN